MARSLGATSDVAEILALINDALRDLLSADRATVFRYDDESNQLVTTVAHGLRNDLIREFRFPVSTGFVSECFRTRRTINVPDCYADERFSPEMDRRTGYRTQSLLCVPLVATDGAAVGVAQVLNRRGGPFTAADERLAEALAAQAAVALHRAELFEAKLRQEKLDRDLALARMMQEATWPDRVPQPPGYEIAVYSRPAEETGGDAYDVLDLDAARVLLFMADATGHGIGPALSVVQVRAMVRMAMRCGTRIETAVEHINAQLHEDLLPGLFVTAFFGRLDTAGHRLVYHSAGQGPLLHYRAATGQCTFSPANGMPLGIVVPLACDAVPAVALEPGDMFLVLSDGLYDGKNPAGEPFGEEGVVAAVKRHAGESAQAVIDAIVRYAAAHAGTHKTLDDCTAIVVRRAT